MFYDPSNEPHRVDQFQLDGYDRGQLLLQRCAGCGHIQEPPRPMCGQCHNLEFDAFESPGRGFLYSWVIPRHGAPESETHVVGCVELDEAIRLVAEIVDTPLEQLENGLAVEAVFGPGQGSERLAFRRRSDASTGAAPTTKVSHRAFALRPRPTDNRWAGTTIAGIGQTEFSKRSGRTELQLAAEASLAAIRDAGLDPSEIDGMVTTTADNNPEAALMECLGINDLTWIGRPPGGGNVASAVIGMAAAAVVSGAARSVLVYRAFNERSGRRYGQPTTPVAPGKVVTARRRLSTPSSVYALWFQRYMYENGVTNEDLGRYAVVARRHASTNPDAWFYKRPISLSDHQSSRWIVEPILRLLDCCQESDGGVALVVTSRERARSGPHPPVVVEAAAQSHAAGVMAGVGYTRSDMGRFDECAAVAAQLYRDTGLRPQDIDAAMIYENFSPVVHLQLEAFGFCPPGQAKHFIADGHIDLGGTLPVNTHGGLLGEAYIHGINNILEAVRQLRGTAANQVADARHVVVSSGPSGLILGRDD
jgi:17-hydroxy-3-oxo-4-pregnene-20-carboxyl-CoA lyase